MDILSAFDGIEVLSQFRDALSEKMAKQVEGFPVGFTWSMGYLLRTLKMNVTLQNYTEHPHMEDIFAKPEGFHLDKDLLTDIF